MDNDDLPIGVTIISTSQFEKKEQYWAGQWSDEELDHSDPFVLWSPIGRQVIEEAFDAPCVSHLRNLLTIN